MAGFRSATSEDFGTQVPNDARCSRPERRAAFERGLPWAWQPSGAQRPGHGHVFCGKEATNHQKNMKN